MDFSHKPVLLEACLGALDIRPKGDYIDGTVGGGGHASAIAQRLDGGRLLGIDQDPAARKAAAERLAPYSNVTIAAGNFAEMDRIAREQGFDPVDGILLDIGVSSHQIDTPGRGFSFHADAPLDMRMSGEGLSAFDVVNTYDEDKLVQILFDYGEERYARSIARNIAKRRGEAPIEGTLELAELVKRSVPPAARRGDRHPALRTFQALRIEVNDELHALQSGIEAAFELLRPGGRLAVITFHSLEDRIVKQRFAALAKGCTCPPDFPICVCGKTPRGKLVTRKPVTATDDELAENPRSRSAKLRAIERIDQPE